MPTVDFSSFPDGDPAGFDVGTGDPRLRVVAGELTTTNGGPNPITWWGGSKARYLTTAPTDAHTIAAEVIYQATGDNTILFVRADATIATYNAIQFSGDGTWTGLYQQGGSGGSGTWTPPALNTPVTISVEVAANADFIVRVGGVQVGAGNFANTTPGNLYGAVGPNSGGKVRKFGYPTGIVSAPTGATSSGSATAGSATSAGIALATTLTLGAATATGATRSGVASPSRLTTGAPVAVSGVGAGTAGPSRSATSAASATPATSVGVATATALAGGAPVALDATSTGDAVDQGPTSSATAAGTATGTHAGSAGAASPSRTARGLSVAVSGVGAGSTGPSRSATATATGGAATASGSVVASTTVRLAGDALAEAASVTGSALSTIHKLTVVGPFGLARLDERRAATRSTRLVARQPAYLAGLVGSATTPDPGPLPNVVTFVYVIRGPLTNQATNETIAAQYEADPQRSWLLRRNAQPAGGYALIAVTSTGGSVGALSRNGPSAPATPVDYGRDEYLAATVTLVSATSTSFIRGWRSLDRGATWADRGVGPAGAALTAHDSTGLLRIGRFGTSGNPMNGRIYSVEARAGGDPTSGDLLWRFDAADYPGTGSSYVDPRGRTWTLPTAGAITRDPDVTYVDEPRTLEAIR